MLTARLSPRWYRCIHCLRDIKQRADGTWADADGFTLCMQATSPAPGQPGVYIPHKPMPQI